MMDIFIAILSTFGAVAILLASIGILRMPDFYLRLSVTVKAATLGVGVLLIAAAIVFPEPEITAKVIAIILFLLLTAPVAAHMIARTGYRSEITMWKETWVDDFIDKYKKKDKESYVIQQAHGT